MRKYGTYEEWQRWLQPGDKLVSKNKYNHYPPTTYTFSHYCYPKNTLADGGVCPPHKGSALFFTPLEDLNSKHNLNCWKPLYRRQKLERILK